MKDGIIREVCIENGCRIEELIEKKADRVELCDNLAAGGTTVSYGVAEYVIARCHAAGIRVMSMVRPRGGNFVYSAGEIGIMLRDIEILCRLKSDGLVFGCLTAQGGLDKKAAAQLAGAARSAAPEIEITFHMAFDHIKPDEQIDSLQWLAETGVTRILTHGGIAGNSFILDNQDRLCQYVKAAAASGQGTIKILPGGGITADNVREVCTALGVHEAHGTRIL